MQCAVEFCGEMQAPNADDILLPLCKKLNLSHRPCNHQLFINATKKRSINSRIVSIANWILHQSTSTQLGRQTFVEKVSSKIVKKVRPGDLIDFVREQFFRVYISEAVMYIASFTLM